MSRTLGCVLFFLAFTSIALAARSNICLATAGAQFYKPLQLYPQDCPNNASNCMAAVYNYSAPDYMFKGPNTLKPTNRESYVFMTQDESDNLDVVVMTTTTYTNNIIKTRVEIDGAEPGGRVLVADDPTEDTWSWDSQKNRGNFSWVLQPKYTDGVVLGHFKFVDNYCFRVEFKPNWNGAISNVVFLSGTVASPKRVISKPLSTSSTFFEFCQYPKALITHTDASCTSLGSASISSIGNFPVSAYLWTKDGVTIGTTSTVNGLQPGEYVATITVEGCTASRPVTISMSGVPVSATWTITNPTKTVQGKIVLAPSGGNPPYAITWKNAAGSVIARNVTTVNNVAAGTYTVSIHDGCSSQEYDITVDAPGTCAGGTFVDADGTCSLCPAGTYSNFVDSDACTVCAPGTHSTKIGATSCDQCSANTYSPGATGPCSSCPTSTYSSAGSGVCTPCPAGTQRASGATVCSSCPAGSFRCDDYALCESCPAGTFSSSGAAACEACDPGTFAASGSSCAACPVNTYAAAGASACTSCPTGTSAPAKSSVLLACM